MLIGWCYVQDGRTNQDAALDKYRKSHVAEHVVFTGVQLRAIWLRTRKMAADFKQKHIVDLTIFGEFNQQQLMMKLRNGRRASS